MEITYGNKFLKETVELSYETQVASRMILADNSKTQLSLLMMTPSFWSRRDCQDLSNFLDLFPVRIRHVEALELIKNIFALQEWESNI